MGINIQHNPPCPLKPTLKPKDKVIAVTRDYRKAYRDVGNKDNYRIFTVRAVSNSMIHLYQIDIPFTLNGEPILNSKSIQDPTYRFWEHYIIQSYE